MLGVVLPLGKYFAKGEDAVDVAWDLKVDGAAFDADDVMFLYCRELVVGFVWEKRALSSRRTMTKSGSFSIRASRL